MFPLALVVSLLACSHVAAVAHGGSCNKAMAGGSTCRKPPASHVAQRAQGDAQLASSSSSVSAAAAAAAAAGSGNRTNSENIASDSKHNLSAAVAVAGHHEDELQSVANLDDLRLEYYKYRILSQLEIKGNPDTYKRRSVDKEALIQAAMEAGHSSVSYHSANSRHKRSPVTCSQLKSGVDSCCLESFYVNFTEIGWDRWILYPSGYYANYCRGRCDLSHSRYYHSAILSTYSAIIGLCCSPKEMSSLQVLYIDDNNNVHSKNMDEMVVEKCDCA